MRAITPFIQQDLRKKMVLLSGPRQVGKSTLAKSLLGEGGTYLNWDIREDQRIIRATAWDKGSSLVVLDELHKFRQWKNFLKGLIDKYQNSPPLLVTGSARLEVFRRAGDALTGRTYLFRLHPIDPAEAAKFMPGSSPKERVDRLLATGGFPEALLNPEDAPRLLNDRLDFVMREDLRDLSATSSLRTIELLIELLRERVGAGINYANIAADLSVAPATVKRWIELLERLFIVFLVHPYSTNFARGLRKEPKIYFYDCSAAYNDTGARLKNLVACSLLNYANRRRDVHGDKLELRYFRDRDGREVDFLLTRGTRIIHSIEVKSSESALHKPLAYLHSRANPLESIQLVHNLDRNLDYNGIKVRQLAQWLSGELYKEKSTDTLPQEVERS